MVYCKHALFSKNICKLNNHINTRSLKNKKHGTDGKCRVWPKPHIAIDTNTEEIIAAELSLSNVNDAEVRPSHQSHLKKEFSKPVVLTRRVIASFKTNFRDIYSLMRIDFISVISRYNYQLGIILCEWLIFNQTRRYV
jgi:hypothetical protein